MSLDLENIQWQEDDLTDTDYGTGSRVHDGLAVALAECAVEAVTVVVGKVVAYEGLSAELVYSLKDLFLSILSSYVLALFNAPCMRRHIRDRGTVRGIAQRLTRRPRL